MMLEHLNDMKTVFFITEMDFWRKGSGCRSRSLKIVEFLSKNTKLTVILTHRKQPADESLIKRLKLSFDCIWLDPTASESTENKISRLEKLMENTDCAIFRSFQNAFLIDAAKNSTTFIDVDDLMSEYEESQYLINQNHTKSITFLDEINLYKKFDKIMLIQSEHYVKFLEVFDERKIMLTQHPVKANKMFFKNKVTHIGFFASGWHANVDGITWFINEVWRWIDEPNVTLDIYGLICSRIVVPQDIKNIRIMGGVNEVGEVYRNIDIAINPVRYGSGVKVKTLEAIGHGIPVVSTAEGARGLSHLIDKAILTCHSSIEYQHAIKLLIKNTLKRKEMSDFGFQYVQENLTVEKCFSSLLNIINAS